MTVVKRIVVLGGGFGGLTAVRELERLSAGRSNVEITLVSRDNFFVMSPLLFEACSGVLELRHCAQPIRPALRRARFVEGTVVAIDVARRAVSVEAAGTGPLELAYDQLVVALGATTNQELIPGSHTAYTFKTMADALVLRNHLIERLERADAAQNDEHRRSCLTVVVVGGGLVGVELLGELTAFADDVVRYYPRVRRDEIRFHLVEAGPRILPEIARGSPRNRSGCSNSGAQTSAPRRRCVPSKPVASGSTTRPSRRRRSYSPPGSSPTAWGPTSPSRSTNGVASPSMRRCAV